jgi:hypothetical protein
MATSSKALTTRTTAIQAPATTTEQAHSDASMLSGLASLAGAKGQSRAAKVQTARIAKATARYCLSGDATVSLPDGTTVSLSTGAALILSDLLKIESRSTCANWALAIDAARKASPEATKFQHDSMAALALVFLPAHSAICRKA